MLNAEFRMQNGMKKWEIGNGKLERGNGKWEMKLETQNGNSFCILNSAFRILKNRGSRGFHQSFEYIIHCGTEGGIFQGDLRPLQQNILVGIGKAFAIRRPYFIDTAVIIRTQEGTGC